MFRALLAHLQEAVYCVHARNNPSEVCAAPPKDKQVMLETCRGP
jgi:hypothetical protein